MISKNTVRLFARPGEIEKIENYAEAVADKENKWVIHHRLELTLDGDFAVFKKDLIRMGMYYHRPYYELIFMKDSDHKKMHRKFVDSSEAVKKATLAAQKAHAGKPFEARHGEFAKLYIAHFGTYPFENHKKYKAMYNHWKRKGILIWEVKNG